MNHSVEYIPTDHAVADHGPFGQAGGASGKEQAGCIFFVQALFGNRRWRRSPDDAFEMETYFDSLALDVQSVVERERGIRQSFINLVDTLPEIIRIDQYLRANIQLYP